MFKTNLKYIYVTRNSFCRLDDINIWDTNVGIMKFDGCVWYGSGLDDAYVGCLKYAASRLDVGGDVPRGTAWLVDTCSGVWVRVDEDMALLDEHTGEEIL